MQNLQPVNIIDSPEIQASVQSVLQILITVISNNANFAACPTNPLYTLRNFQEWKTLVVDLFLLLPFPSSIQGVVAEYLKLKAVPDLILYHHLRKDSFWPPFQEFYYLYTTYSASWISNSDYTKELSRVLTVKFPRVGADDEFNVHEIVALLVKDYVQLRNLFLVDETIFPYGAWMKKQCIPYPRCENCGQVQNILSSLRKTENNLITWRLDKDEILQNRLLRGHHDIRKTQVNCCENKVMIYTNYVLHPWPPILWISCYALDGTEELARKIPLQLDMSENVHYELESFIIEPTLLNRCSMAVMKWGKSWFLTYNCKIGAAEVLNDSRLRSLLYTRINLKTLHNNCQKSFQHEDNDDQYFTVDFLVYRQVAHAPKVPKRKRETSH
jgi:hypothetical protein